MEYPKVKAMIAAQRFKNLIANKTEAPESEPEPEPEPEPVETPPPVAPPKKRRRRRKEAAGFRDIDLVYIVSYETILKASHFSCGRFWKASKNLRLSPAKSRKYLQGTFRKKWIVD